MLLPVLPLLRGELTVEDTKQRLASLDLVAKVGSLLTCSVRAAAHCVAAWLRRAALPLTAYSHVPRCHSC